MINEMVIANIQIVKWILRERKPKCFARNQFSKVVVTEGLVDILSEHASVFQLQHRYTAADPAAE